MDSKYQEALGLYNQCDYEQAYSILFNNDLHTTNKGKLLFKECEKQILQQYTYLIKDYIEQEMYGEAIGLRQYYYTQYGFSSQLSSIEIPEPIQHFEEEESPKIEQKTSEETIKKDTAIERKSNKTKLLIGVLSIILIAVISLFIYNQSPEQNNIDEKGASQLKYSSIINELNSDSHKLVLYVNQASTTVYYVEKKDNSFHNNIIYKYSIPDNITYEINCENIKCTDGKEIYIHSSFNDIIINNGKVLLKGWNGGNGISEEHYVVRFYPEFVTFKLLLSTGFNESIEYKDEKFIVTKRDLLKNGNAKVNDEYFYYQEYYTIEGAHIDGFNVRGKGKIDKYSINMFFHCLKGNITGWYQYKGHDNYMIIKGKTNANNQFSFTEYDENGNTSAVFTGKVDFVNQMLHGYFNNNNNQLEFLIYNDLEPQSCVNAWNYIHNPSFSNCVYLNNLYGENVTFYGAKFTSIQCLNHFLPIKSYSQKIVNDIKYTSIDNLIIRCDFIKGVNYKGKYREYEAYLILKRKDEYSPWRIIVESDKTTDYNLKLRN